jgi:hypothetical protein
MSIANNIGRPRPIFKNLSPTFSDTADLSSFIRYWHTRKILSTQPGTWEVVLAPVSNTDKSATRADFQSVIYQSIRPMDAVIVGTWGRGFDDNDVYSEQEIMFGFVDGVYKSLTQINGRTERTIVVRGRDATKLFAVDNIANAPELAIDDRVREAFKSNEQVLSFMNYLRGWNPKTKKNVFYDGSLVTVFNWILDNMPSMRLKLDCFEGKSGNEKNILSPKDFFQMFLLARAEDKVFADNMNMYAGSVLNYFSNLIDRMFYELWIDTVPKNSPGNSTGKTRPCIILRPKPFDYQWETTNSRGDKLVHNYLFNDDKTKKTDPITWNNFVHPITGQASTIPTSEITEMKVGVTDEEVFSMYKIGGAKDLIATSLPGKYGYLFPLLDINLIKAYGMRELAVDTRLAPPSVDQLSQVLGYESKEQLIRSARDEVAKTWGQNILLNVKAGGDPESQLQDAIEAITNSQLEKLQKTSAIQVLTTDKRDRLWRWNRCNHLYEGGTVTMRGRNLFVGQKLIFPDEYSRGIFNESTKQRESSKGMEYYCISVDHSGGSNRPWQTSLGINRGANMKDIEGYFYNRGWNKPTSVDNGIITING